MFRARCDAEGREVLLTTRRITAIDMRDGETEIRFACWCGHEGIVVDPAVPRPGAAPARPARPVGPTPGRAA